MTPEQQRMMEGALAVIAQRKLNIDLLAEILEFREVGVWDLREALITAYSAGMVAAGKVR